MSVIVIDESIPPEEAPRCLEPAEDRRQVAGLLKNA